MFPVKTIVAAILSQQKGSFDFSENQFWLTEFLVNELHMNKDPISVLSAYTEAAGGVEKDKTWIFAVKPLVDHLVNKGNKR